MSPLLTAVLAGAFGLILLVWVAARLASIDRRLSRLEARLDQPAQPSGAPLAGSPASRPAAVPDGVLEALRSGNKIEAIKRYREATGAGLAEAKDFVEGVERRMGR